MLVWIPPDLPDLFIVTSAKIDFQASPAKQDVDWSTQSDIMSKNVKFLKYDYSSLCILRVMVLTYTSDAVDVTKNWSIHFTPRHLSSILIIEYS